MFEPQTTVAAIVHDHSECAAVLDRYRIDCCCQGARSLAEVCVAGGARLEDVTSDLELAVARRAPNPIDPRGLGTRELVRKVLARHHRYLHRTLPFLRHLAAKVARVHGDRDPHLFAVATLVDDLASVLVAHLADEEHHLFPDLLAEPVPPGVEIGLAHMREEHEDVVRRFEELRAIAAGYAIPAYACPSYRALMGELAVLEADTRRHLAIENDLLLPAIAAAA